MGNQHTVLYIPEDFHVVTSPQSLETDLNHQFYSTDNEPGKPRILHISFNEPLNDNERQIIENKFPGLVKKH